MQTSERNPASFPTDALIEGLKLTDNGEEVRISALALLKMLKHGRAGVPFEEMGLMLLRFVDDYLVLVVDVFAMPQSGTGVSVEAVDPVFQTEMLDMLKMVGRSELVVGWYHSHPGFGCWLSTVDQNTQASFEGLNPLSVAVVIDPIQSVRGKVIIDAFRLIDPQVNYLTRGEPRQVTLNIGHRPPSLLQRVRGVGNAYYMLNITYKMSQVEKAILSTLGQKNYTNWLKIEDFKTHEVNNSATKKEMVRLGKEYKTFIDDETKLTPKAFSAKRIGQQDPKKRLEDIIQESMAVNVDQLLKASSSLNMFKQ